MLYIEKYFMKNTEHWKAIDRILWEDWDPIGINDVAPKDEYQMYIPSILKLLEEQADELKIANLLLEHANNNMGLSTHIKQHIEIAKKLKNIFQ